MPSTSRQTDSVSMDALAEPIVLEKLQWHRDPRFSARSLPYPELHHGGLATRSSEGESTCAEEPVGSRAARTVETGAATCDSVGIPECRKSGTGKSKRTGVASPAR